ncbi:ABC transporter permease [Phenylobacterium sp.]|uniref:ABC transporter permease n=1 Tax=Phenylobacterium sp. TaxID=1871053 RepID=UPI002737B6FD|nr:ABC transporter permease [Phenylobacterium sp.]MDP3869315.1 ABC transporter permease [Phenylobacterium sp.]
MRRLWLIAQREIAAYASVPSFWVALLLGPALMLATSLVGAAMAGPGPSAPPPAQSVVLRVEDPALRATALAAIETANGLGRSKLAVQALGSDPPADTVIDISGAQVVVRGQALSAIAAEVLRRDLTATLQQRTLREAGVSDAALDAAQAVRVDVAWIKLAPTAPGSQVGPQVGRFAIVMLLWMNLIGALGMLLQAIVRERSNRALDSLLASARSSEIIFGKLLGVGVLSVFVLAAWLAAGAAVAASPLGGLGGGLQTLLLAAFKSPATLVQAGAFYLLAFAMYGSAMIGVGAVAKDLPAAQNLSRPIFGLLLLVFFVALTQLSGDLAQTAWLAWVPPFTPFVILMAPPGTLPLAHILGAFVLMLLTTVAVGAAAAMALTEAPLARARRALGFRSA